MGKRAIPLYGCAIFMVFMAVQVLTSAWSCLRYGQYYVQTKLGKGYYKYDCYNCRTGHHSEESEKTYCDPCDRGHFQDEEGKRYCKRCLKGSYQPKTGQSSCVTCPKGYTTKYEGEAGGNGACVTYAYALKLRPGKTYNCGLQQPCNPLVTPGLRAYPALDINSFVACPLRQTGGNRCVIRRCPGGTEFDPRPQFLRCFSYTAFDCVSRDPCHLAGGTGQYKYAYITSRKYVDCELQTTGWIFKCVIKACGVGEFIVPNQSCG